MIRFFLHRETTALDTDTRFAFALAALYLALSAALLPPAEYARALGGGIAVFAAVFGAAWVLGRGKVHAMSVFAVIVASGLVLVRPAFPAMGGTTPIALPLGFLGMQAAVLLWAARRWTPRVPAREPTPLREACRLGVFVAAALSAIATIPVLIGFHVDGWGAAPILLVYPGYFAGMLSAATVYWLLQRVAHLALGRYLIGVLGGFCVYGAMVPIVMLTEGEPLGLGRMLSMSGVLGAIAGPALSLEFAED